MSARSPPKESPSRYQRIPTSLLYSLGQVLAESYFLILGKSSNLDLHARGEWFVKGALRIMKAPLCRREILSGKVGAIRELKRAAESAVRVTRHHREFTMRTRYFHRRAGARAAGIQPEF